MAKRCTYHQSKANSSSRRVPMTQAGSPGPSPWVRAAWRRRNSPPHAAAMPPAV